MRGGITVACAVAQSDIIWIAEFAQQKWLLDLSDYANGRKGEFIPSTLSSFDYDGKLWGLPQVTGAGRLYRRTDQVPDAPASWQQMYSGAAKNDGFAERGDTGWPVDVVAFPPTPENVEAALRDGPYGRCVWACDNDVVDHQVLAMEYDGGVTATLTMTAFTRMRARETRIFGTRRERRVVAL